MKKSVLSPRWSCLSRSFDICKNRQTKTALPSHKQMEGISRLFRSGQVPLKSLHKHQISSVAILRVHKPKSLCVKPWSLMNVSVGPVWVESHPWGGSESVHVGAACSFFSRPLTSIPSALQHQRLDRPNCPICGLIYTEILISSVMRSAHWIMHVHIHNPESAFTEPLMGFHVFVLPLKWFTLVDLDLLHKYRLWRSIDLVSFYRRCIQALWEIGELLSEPDRTSTWNIQGRRQNKNNASVFETTRWTFPPFYSFWSPVIVWFSCHDNVMILKPGSV